MNERDSDRFRLIAETSRDMISRTNARGVCTYVSPASRDVLGYEPEELVGTSLFDLAHPDEREKNQAAFESAVTTGKLLGGTHKTRMRRKDGSYAWIESTTKLVRDAEGAVVAIQSSGRDVSERIATEDALAQSEKNFHALIDQLPHAIVVHRGGRFVYANASLVRLLGYDSASEIVGRAVLDVVHVEDRESIAARIAARDRVYAPTPEHRLLRKDGGEVVVQVTGMPIVFQGALADLALIEDLTARKALESELLIADRMAALGKLAAAVGHEINNPLAYVLVNLELLREDASALGDAAAPVLRRLATIQEGVDRVRSIVADLRHFSSVHDAALGPVDVAGAIERAVSTTSHETRLRARVVRELRSTRRAHAEERRLVQVLVNLIVNAAHATPEGHAEENEIRIVTRDEPEGSIAIEVWDTGIGLPSGNPAKLFEPFFTTKQPQAGVGLGLSISHRIVSSFGGTIRAERRPDRGSVFRISLPAAAQAEVAPKCPPELVEPRARLRVLIVDDERAFALALATLLDAHEVVVEHSGRAAIDRFANDARFDVVLCDLQMRDGTGAEVYEHARTARPGLEKRFVFMTGGVFTEHARSFMRECAQPVLEKPFMAAKLHATIAQITAADS
jgi:two-component system cell cycle sensor histidine kinase/response regulator CckA